VSIIDFNTHVDVIMTSLESVTHYFEISTDEVERRILLHLKNEYMGKLKELGTDVDINNPDIIHIYKQKIATIQDFISDISSEMARNGTEKCDYYYED